MELKCLNLYTSSLILASLTLIVCILRAEFLISVLKDTTDPQRSVDGFINVLLYANLMVYLILAVLCILLIYAIIQKRHALMIPWLIVALLNVLCETVFVIYVLASGHSKYVLYITIGTVLTVWMIWTIFSFYRAVRQENRTKRLEELRFYRYSAARNIEIY